MDSRMLHRRGFLKVLGSATAVGVFVAACGGGAQTPAAPTTAPQAAPAAPTSASQGTTPTQASAQATTAATPVTAATSAATPQQAAGTTPTTAAAANGAGPTPTPNPLASVPIKSGVKTIEWWFGWG